MLGKSDRGLIVRHKAIPAAHDVALIVQEVDPVNALLNHTPRNSRGEQWGRAIASVKK
jgi:hypothetical protein